ncbi:iron chaperone [Arthrobacter sulfonylureivorans]|uniref:iron chaperone n=1 Tax=Arthrobacter sulfonylureivorans TaxID=2486855 RepID=UPI0039E432F2
MNKPQTVDEYLESFPEEAARRLAELRQLSRTHVPQADEGLKWGNPAYSLDGTIMFIFAGYQQHANFVFTPSTLDAFSAELAGFQTGKGSIKLPYSGPVPAELLGRMMAHRIREFREDGVLWM